jgi:hypothetical protein
MVGQRLVIGRRVETRDAVGILDIEGTAPTSLAELVEDLVADVSSSTTRARSSRGGARVPSIASSGRTGRRSTRT